MNLTKKITQIFSLIFLAFLIASCDPGCVEEDEFDTESTLIESKPTNDGIYGTYDNVDGGQRAEWHDTGLRSNGDRFLIQIAGAWVPWNGSSMTDAKLKLLSACFPNKICAKQSGGTAPNCICYAGQNPAPEKAPDGNPVATTCSTYTDQNDPMKCTCTRDPQYGNALSYGVYHFPTNYYDKNETVRNPDYQSECKLNRGMGAYIALFGSRGTEIPVRAYHLFSTEEICNIVRNANGECIDSNGNDLTRYVFKSANNRIFMKDDNNGNNGTDSNTSDDVYHGPNEVVKTIMFDRYYTDNYGRYNMIILRGVGNANDVGLIEFLVRLVEDTVLGKVDNNGERQGGIIEFMYKSIVQDSNFIVILQITLSLYVMFYGLAHLFGVAEINKKELMSRVLKIGLIMLFTSKDSWVLYNKIVVSFFKDSMDYVVSVLMSLSDSNIDQTSIIKISQMDRQTDISNATRFSYVDLVIKKLLSIGTAKKIFGLFFGAIFFGMLYIPIIYALIGYFIFVMLFVASMYLVNVLKIVFVLSLGPIFMCFTLFKQTEGMFKNWLAFLGARSLEIILLFAVLYNFLVLIDKNFTDLLTYRSCLELWGVGPVKLKILKSYINRPLIEWFLGFITIGGLIFIMHLVVKKSQDLAGQLVSIGGKGAGSSGAGESGKGGLANMVNGMMQGITGLAKQARDKGFDVVKTASAMAISGGTAAARKTGVADTWNKIGEAMGFRGIRTRVRDSIIDGAIKKAEAMAGGRTGLDRDKFIRGQAHKMLMAEMHANPNKMTFAGVNMDSIGRRLDKQLVEKPLKNFLKDEAKKLKGSGKFLSAKEMNAALEKSAKEWANKNLVGGADTISSYLGKSNIQQLMKSQGQYTTSEAAKSFAKNEDAKNQYLAHLKEREFERRKSKEDARAKGNFSRFTNWLGRGYDNLTRSAELNPKMAQENFMRKVAKEEETRTWAGFFNPLNRVNIIDKAMNYDRIKKATDAAGKKFMMSALAEGSGDSRKDAFFQRKLSEAATADLQKAAKQVRNLEKSGKKSEADSLRSELIKGVRDEFASGKGSLFDRMARLSYLHGQFNLGGDDPRALLSKAMRDQFEKKSEEISKGLADKSLSAIEARKQLEEMRAMQAGLYGDGKGSEDALKKVLEDFDKDSSSRFIGPRISPDAGNAAIIGDHDAMRSKFGELSEALRKEAEDRIDAAQSTMDQVGKSVAEIDAKLAAGSITTEEAKKELEGYQNLIKTKVEVEFGSSITDALIKEVNVGLTAGNPLLGATAEGKKDVDYAALQALGMSKNVSAGKAKMAKMEEKVLEFELTKLREEAKKDPSKLAEVASLERKLSEAKDEAEKYQREVEKIEATEDLIKKS